MNFFPHFVVTLSVPTNNNLSHKKTKWQFINISFHIKPLIGVSHWINILILGVKFLFYLTMFLLNSLSKLAGNESLTDLDIKQLSVVERLWFELLLLFFHLWLALDYIKSGSFLTSSLENPWNMPLKDCKSAKSFKFRGMNSAFEGSF